jgi:hypothetical protein
MGEVPAHQGLKPLATNARPPGEEHAPIRTAHVRGHPQTLNTYWETPSLSLRITHHAARRVIGRKVVRHPLTATATAA